MGKPPNLAWWLTALSAFIVAGDVRGAAREDDHEIKGPLDGGE